MPKLTTRERILKYHLHLLTKRLECSLSMEGGRFKTNPDSWKLGSDTRVISHYVSAAQLTIAIEQCLKQRFFKKKHFYSN